MELVDILIPAPTDTDHQTLFFNSRTISLDSFVSRS
jgi:hypothetical protein